MTYKTKSRFAAAGAISAFWARVRARLNPSRPPPEAPPEPEPDSAPKPASPSPSGERGGPKGPEPTRYGDWERKGRAIDF